MKYARLPVTVLVVFTVAAHLAGQSSNGEPGAADRPKPLGDTVSQPVKENPRLPEKRGSRPAADHKLSLSKEKFGTLQDGREVTLFTCRNANGMTLAMIDYGAIVVALEAYDREGTLANVNLGFDNLAGYLQRHPYFGATVGRYCNRIAGAKFTLDGKEYKLYANDGANHLHGGRNGLDRVLWTAETIETADSVGVTFRYESPDGEEGYPGNLRVTAEYALTNDNELRVTLSATTDKPTPVNLTNHCYWNLAGAPLGQSDIGTILDHEVMINADQYLAVDKTQMPTGDIVNVAGTPLDFRQPERIGARIKQLNTTPQGYDHCYVLRAGDGETRLAARVRDPKSGRIMEIHTTQPGIQFYTGNYLDGTAQSGGFRQYSALCLETQHFPNSPNQPNFPSTILRPGETFRHVTIHKFMVE
jgi:aldose 1-epimerase